MSATATPVLARPETPAARMSRAPRNPRLALLFAVILVTSLTAVALSAVSFAKPIGESDGLPDYAAIASNRAYIWAFFAAAAVQLIIGACAVALAGMLLAPARGARWATVGGSCIWLGAAIYAVGVGGWAAVYYFGTDPTLAPGTAAALIDHVNDDTARMLAVPIGGALLVTLGSLLLCVALWRARTVPRWVPILGVITAVTAIVIPPDTVAGVFAEGASSATSIAVGWYAWRLHCAGSRDV